MVICDWNWARERERDCSAHWNVATDEVSSRSTEIQIEAQRYFWIDASSLWRCSLKYTWVQMQMCACGAEKGAAWYGRLLYLPTSKLRVVYWQMKAWFVLRIIKASFNIIQSVHSACKTIYLHQHVATTKCMLSINTTLLHVLLSSSLSHCYLLYVFRSL
jgi:hypothetical protein